MSRTKHQTKGPGYEYWGRRSHGGSGKHLCSPGSFTKTVTHRKERRAGKRECAE